MKRRKKSKKRRNRNDTKASQMSTTSNYSGSQSLRSIRDDSIFRSRITWKNMLQQFMMRRNHLKTERLGSCPKVSTMSTTSNYSGSQSLSSVCDIQFSIFFLNFLKLRIENETQKLNNSDHAQKFHK